MGDVTNRSQTAARPDTLGVAITREPDRRTVTVWTTHFVDLSNNNGKAVNLRQVAHDSRSTGITAAELKASEGTHFVDGMYAGWRDEGERWGLRTFAYHFARPDVNPGTAGAEAEADHFCQVVGQVRPGEWRPMLDFETAPFDQAWARAWNTRVRERLGVAPLFYCYGAAIDGMHLRQPIGAGLVFAYPNGVPGSAPCPPPWKHWTAHQYSWHGLVRGIASRVDLNYTPTVRTMLAYPVQGAALEPAYRRRRRRA